jgi:hypothetical protein
VFRIAPPPYVTAEIVEFVRQRIESPAENQELRTKN